MKSIKELDIEAIKDVFNLTCILMNDKHILVATLAKKLKTSDLELMEFINQNPNLFYLEPKFSYRKVKKKTYPWGSNRPFIEDVSVPSKNLGIGIRSVYKDAADNFRTDEWLKKQTELHEKYIHISEADNYGYIQGYYVAPDAEDKQYRTHIWRNSVEKIQRLKKLGFGHEGTFVYGGIGDSYTQKVDFELSVKEIERLSQIGWEHNKIKPLSK